MSMSSPPPAAAPSDGEDQPEGRTLTLTLDTLTVVFSFLEHAALGAARLVAHDWRRAALCPTLPAWRELSQQTFVALGSERGSRRGWDFAALELALRAKPCVASLDLSFCRVRWNSATSGALGALPASLQTLTLSHGCAEPRDVLTSLLPTLPGLPALRRLDLRGVLTMASARELDVAARLDGWRPPALHLGGDDATRTVMSTETESEEQRLETEAKVLPALEYLSVGFSLHSGRRSATDARGGSVACLLRELMARAPRLRAVGCHVAASLLQPVDVHCRVCGTPLYTDLGLHVVHPPQQQHISYEVYTDAPPDKAVPSLDSGEVETLGQTGRLAAATSGHHGLLRPPLKAQGCLPSSPTAPRLAKQDATRLQCPMRCLGQVRCLLAAACCRAATPSLPPNVLTVVCPLPSDRCGSSIMAAASSTAAASRTPSRAGRSAGCTAPAWRGSRRAATRSEPP